MRLSSWFVLTAIAFSPAVFSAGPEIVLWPGRPPGPEPQLEAERDVTKETDGKVGGRILIRLGNVSNPTLTLYPAEANKATGTAMLVCPGGGYNILAMDLEGTEVCERLNDMGITAVLLKYRVPRRPNLEKHVAPLQDAQRAMGLIRQHASEWKINPDKVGVLGFSAGGHLAAMLSNQSNERNYPRIDRADDLPSRPNFSVLVYPAYLSKESDGMSLVPELVVSTNTPEAFVTITQDDPVRVENGFAYGMALQRHKVPFELHIYPTGGHGYGLRKTKEPVTAWPDRLQEWLLARGLLRAN